MRNRMRCGLRCPVMLVLGLLLVAPLLPAQEDRAGQQDFMLLQSRFGELCTMCEAMVLCTAAEGQAASSGAPGVTLYHFHTKTFWGQVRTIYEYLIRWIVPVTTGSRPVTIAELPTGASRIADARNSRTMAYLVVDPAVIEIDDRRIDRWSGAWQDRDGRGLGSCRRLPLRETLQAMEEPAFNLREVQL